jgi:signal transduction histidine kinase
VQDAERRRLERNLHDGAQQNLVSLRMKLGLAQAAATHTSGPLSGLLEQMQMELGEALESVRSLSRGIYPPLLESQGLKGALTARARQIGIPVTVDCGPERHPPEVEVAIYFCCAEALQNVSKHSGAGHATLRVWSEDGGLRFTVSDDGRGFSPSASTNGHGLQNLRDRLETLGGTLDVQAGRGRGTMVTGWLPVADGTRAMSVAGRDSVVG